MNAVAARPASPEASAPRLLWGIRLASGAFLVLALPLSLLPEFLSGHLHVDLPFFTSLSLPALYGLALWLLRGNPPTRFGLALVTALGTTWSGICLVGAVGLVLAALEHPRSDPAGILLLVLLLALQLIYGRSAAREYFRLEKGHGAGGKLASAYGLVLLVMGVFGVSMTAKLDRGQLERMRKQAPIGELATINIAEVQYARPTEGTAQPFGRWARHHQASRPPLGPQDSSTTNWPTQ